MKKLLIIVLVSTIAFSASARESARGGRWYHGRSHVVVSAGVYAPFYSPYYDYYPFYPPYTAYRYRPTRLELKIDDIKNDYRDKIWSTRHDKTINRQERRKEVHQLKHDRDKEINETTSSYYKPAK